LKYCGSAQRGHGEIIKVQKNFVNTFGILVGVTLSTHFIKLIIVDKKYLFYYVIHLYHFLYPHIKFDI